MGVTSAWGKGMISIFFRQYFQKHIGSEKAWFFFPFSVYLELSSKLRLGGGKLIKKRGAVPVCYTILYQSYS